MAPPIPLYREAIKKRRIYACPKRTRNCRNRQQMSNFQAKFLQSGRPFFPLEIHSCHPDLAACTFKNAQFVARHGSDARKLDRSLIEKTENFMFPLTRLRLAPTDLSKTRTLLAT